MTNELIFVQYTLFGVHKTIAFNCFSQYKSWSAALEVLGDNFKVNLVDTVEV